VLLLDEARLTSRREAVAGPLAALFDGLTRELEPVLQATPAIPREKALLTRAGGRCEADGTTLEFDPASPHAHRCPACGAVHRDVVHHRAWITSYQLWLAERALHAALFNLLRPDEHHERFARDTLRAYADLYLGYPNVDNVLGPSRLFFSTYLESIWLLQICLAAGFLRAAGDDATAQHVLDRIVEPGSAMVAGYDEHLSNRQVWNNAALLAAAALASDRDAIGERVAGRSGLQTHLEHGLLADGTWYEGENYHQFALRGLWYGVTLAETAGHPLDAALLDRFHRAFATPYLSALPDFTMVARKDSQYAVSLRQWCTAETAELGFARVRDPVLGQALRRTYETGHERRDTGRARSTADVERNGPSSALTRADLGWRALLHALPELPELPAGSPRSALLEGQGLAVFRRPDDVFIAVDYGQSGGGHGHPDRLNLLLSQRRTRWLDDMGTGSYVDPSLHWFRSTLAHNAPIVNGRSQTLHGGELVAYDEREGMGWIRAQFTEGEVVLERTVVIAPNYLLDELRWDAPAGTRIELPYHVDGSAEGVPFAPAVLDGGDGLEDGFGHVTDVTCASLPASGEVVLRGERDGHTLRVALKSASAGRLFRARGPGQPPTVKRSFFVLRTVAAERSGSVRAHISWSEDVGGVVFGSDDTTVSLAGPEQHVHRPTRDGWHVDLEIGSARSSIDLAGWRHQRAPGVPPPAAGPRRDPIVIRRSEHAQEWLSDLPAKARSELVSFSLGEPHYRRSEMSWREAGGPTALVVIAADRDGRSIALRALIEAGDPLFADAKAVNTLDNEHPDTMAAGLQLYVRLPRGSGGWMLIPEPGSETMRVRGIDGWRDLGAPRGSWRPWRTGWEARVEIPLDDESSTHVDLDVLINETVRGRARRRGQLVLSGADGEFVYLRGDRHDPARLLPLRIEP